MQIKYSSNALKVMIHHYTLPSSDSARNFSHRFRPQKKQRRTSLIINKIHGAKEEETEE